MGTRLTAGVHGSVPRLLTVSDASAEPCRVRVSAAWNEFGYPMVLAMGRGNNGRDGRLTKKIVHVVDINISR